MLTFDFEDNTSYTDNSEDSFDNLDIFDTLFQLQNNITNTNLIQDIFDDALDTHDYDYYSFTDNTDDDYIIYIDDNGLYTIKDIYDSYYPVFQEELIPNDYVVIIQYNDLNFYGPYIGNDTLYFLCCQPIHHLIADAKTLSLSADFKDFAKHDSDCASAIIQPIPTVDLFVLLEKEKHYEKYLRYNAKSINKNNVRFGGSGIKNDENTINVQLFARYPYHYIISTNATIKDLKIMIILQVKGDIDLKVFQYQDNYYSFSALMEVPLYYNNAPVNDDLTLMSIKTDLIGTNKLQYYGPTAYYLPK